MIAYHLMIPVGRVKSDPKQGTFAKGVKKNLVPEKTHSAAPRSPYTVDHATSRE